MRGCSTERTKDGDMTRVSVRFRRDYTSQPQA